MVKIFRKKLSLLLVLILTATSLSGCITVNMEDKGTKENQSKSNVSQSNNENSTTNNNSNSTNNSTNNETNTVESKKTYYLNKLNSIENQCEAMYNDDETMYETRQSVGTAYKLWDDVLNEIWKVLKEQLPSDEMNELTIEERSWIKQKDYDAEQAGKECEGGSLQPLYEVSSKIDSTKERCYYLVNNYMK